MIKEGTEIITKSGKIRAIITACCVRGGNISYEVSYFINHEYKQCWLYQFEFDLADEVKKAGFNYTKENNLLTS